MFILKPKKLAAGFTLIEIIMVMAIIGVLVGIVLLNFPAATARARDTERKSDLYQFRTALETYANSHDGFYPEGIDDKGDVIYKYNYDKAKLD